MRKERLIVPLLIGGLLAWMAGQAASSWFFERELSLALEDMQARGELEIERVDIERGWWVSTGHIHLAPLLDDGWQLEVTYRARHGVLNTYLNGDVTLHHGPDGVRFFDDALASSSPLWEARYRTLSRQLEGGLRIAPMHITQQARELTLQGGTLRFSGERGSWQLRAQFLPWVLSDGDVRLAAGPATLNSEYAYTAGAHAFHQLDHLHIEALAWHQPELKLDASDIQLAQRIILDERELRIQLQLDLGEIHTAEKLLLAGRVDAELSRLNADALRSVMKRLRTLAADSGQQMSRQVLLAELEPQLLSLLEDSPRLDLSLLELESPMLGLSAKVDGALFLDGRQPELLSLTELDDPAVQQNWRQRLDGDFVWHELPTVVALWLGLPLDTRTLQIDIGRGQVRVNGRPLPPLGR